MLKHRIIELNWNSPRLLVPKSNGSYSFCMDYRKVNAVTKSDSYPIPTVEGCIDRIGYVTKLDLLKGYWQVLLTPAARDFSICDTRRVLPVQGNAI